MIGGKRCCLLLTYVLFLVLVLFSLVVAAVVVAFLCCYTKHSGSPKRHGHLAEAMIEVACMREWFGTAQGMIEFRRCLVQALDIRLLQIPHFTEKHVELCRKATPPVTSLKEFLALEPDQRRQGPVVVAW
eukprot:Skav206527  [mRNA]  locus=scaffold5046:162948:164728:+ [translate_table: standard]